MRRVATELARYVLTGGAAAIVDVGGFALLHAAGLAIAVAAALSFCIAAAVNYALTARFVFKSAASARGFGLFFAVALVGLAINVGATVMLSERADLAPVLAKVGGVAIAFLANFAMNKLLVFRRREMAP